VATVGAVPDMFLLVSGLTVVKYQGKRAKICLSLDSSLTLRMTFVKLRMTFVKLGSIYH